MIKGFIVKKLNENLIIDLIYLYKICFDKDVTQSEVKNKHINCDGKIKYVGFIAYDDNTHEPAAYYGVFPNYMCYKNNKILIAQSGDTMTSPNYRKKGLFIKLAEITFNFCTENNIRLITGLPNKLSIGGFKKYLSFTQVENLTTLTFFENKFHYNRFYIKRKKIIYLNEKLINKILGKFLNKPKMFKNSNKNSKNAYMIHQSNFHNNKIKNNDYCISFKNNKIWIRVEINRLVICDINLIDKSSIKKELFLMKILTLMLGKRFLSHTCTKNSFTYLNFEKFSNKKSNNYNLIFRSLGLDINFNKIVFLECDADVF